MSSTFLSLALLFAERFFRASQVSFVTTLYRRYEDVKMVARLAAGGLGVSHKSIDQAVWMPSSSGKWVQCRHSLASFQC
jgi:hypothetical protein